MFGQTFFCINMRKMNNKYHFTGMIKKSRPSLQDAGCSSQSGRKDSVGKKVLKTGSFDAPAPISPGSVTGSVSTYLDDVLDQHAIHLLEDCSIQDLGIFFMKK